MWHFFELIFFLWKLLGKIFGCNLKLKTLVTTHKQEKLQHQFRKLINVLSLIVDIYNLSILNLCTL